MRPVRTIVSLTQEDVSSLGGVFQGGKNLHIFLLTNISQLLRGLGEHSEGVKSLQPVRGGPQTLPPAGCFWADNKRCINPRSENNQTRAAAGNYGSGSEDVPGMLR